MFHIRCLLMPLSINRKFLSLSVAPAGEQPSGRANLEYHNSDPSHVSHRMHWHTQQAVSPAVLVTKVSLGFTSSSP